MPDGNGTASSGSSDRGAKRDAAEAPEATHYLHLSDGRVIEHAGAIPTHYSDDKGVYRVTAAYEKEASQ
jgi:hypothetical protein